jgi:hypothetical protein
MDVSYASYYIHKNNENKGSRMGQTRQKKQDYQTFNTSPSKFGVNATQK